MAQKFAGMSLAAAAMLIASAGGSIVYGPADIAYHEPTYRPPRKSPNDDGPVVDTTPESKRAKRRRLSREFKRAKRL